MMIYFKAVTFNQSSCWTSKGPQHLSEVHTTLAFVCVSKNRQMWVYTENNGGWGFFYFRITKAG